MSSTPEPMPSLGSSFATPRRAKPPMLFICGFLPTDKVLSAGQKIVFEVLKEKARDFDITLLAFKNQHEQVEESFDGLCSKCQIYPVLMKARLMAFFTCPTVPYFTAARFAQGRAFAEEWKAKHPNGQVWMEFTQAAIFVSVFQNSTQTTTLVVHDLFHQSILRRAERSRFPLRSLLEWESARTGKLEFAMIKAASHVLTLTEKDKVVIEKTTGRKDVQVRYPNADKQFGDIRRDASTIQKGTLMYWGQMSRKENEDAALWFIEAILPLIKKSVPHAEFWVAGAAPSDKLKQQANDYIKVLGFVESPASVFSRTAVAVAPLRIGSGIKVKVVEYLAAGLPTVATHVGAEGVTANELLHVADEPAEFAAKCSQLLLG